MLAAAMMVAAISANAQVYVGGGIGFESSKANKDASSLSAFTIVPEVGYKLDEKWAVGIQLGYGSKQTMGKTQVTDEEGNTTGAGKITTSVFTVAPYARYTFAKSGIASFFVDGGIQFTSLGSDSKGSTFGVGLRPGVKFAASDKIDLVARLGYLGYRTANEDAQALGYGFEKDYFGFNVNGNALEFSIYYNL